MCILNFLLNFTESFFIMKYYDTNMLKAFWILSQLVDFQSCPPLPHCWHATLQMERETQKCGRKKWMDGEVIVNSQGAVGEVKHIAWGLFQISLSCGCGCVFWLLRFRLSARWTLTCCLPLFSTSTDSRQTSFTNLYSWYFNRRKRISGCLFKTHWGNNWIAVCSFKLTA